MVRKYQDLDGKCPVTQGARAAFDHAQIASTALKYNLEEMLNDGVTPQEIEDIKTAIDLELDWGAISCAYEALVEKLMRSPAFQRASDRASEKHGRELFERSLEAAAARERGPSAFGVEEDTA
jgi:hypothetical protein